MAPKAKAGTCMRCGCTERRACVVHFGTEDGIVTKSPCWWVDHERTRCSGCFYVAPIYMSWAGVTYTGKHVYVPHKVNPLVVASIADTLVSTREGQS